MVILRALPHVLLPQYLQVVINSPAFIDQISARLSGSVQSQLPINKLAQLDFPLPRLSEQRRIADEVKALQAKVDTLKLLQTETAAELGALTPSILSKAFSGEL